MRYLFGSCRWVAIASAILDSFFDGLERTGRVERFLLLIFGVFEDVVLLEGVVAAFECIGINELEVELPELAGRICLRICFDVDV